MERQKTAATRVYDILDVGLRKRFTVRGQNGEIMLVHNCENAVQATARDILRDAMVRLEARGYTIILTVHDEILCEEELGEGTVEEVCALMAEVPTWAKGLPVRAEGWEGQRYRKE